MIVFGGGEAEMETYCLGGRGWGQWFRRFRQMRADPAMKMDNCMRRLLAEPDAFCSRS